MTCVLAFDCSCANVSIAIASATDATGIRVHGARDEALPQGHAAHLLPLIEATLRGAAVGLDAVDLFAVTVGPGSFTGVRIGLATARGLALATRKPLAGYTTLCVLLAAASDTPARPSGGPTLATPVVAAIDTKRGDMYLQIDGAPAFVGDVAMLHERLPSRAAHIVGDAASSAARGLALHGVDASSDPEIVAPDARVLARLALRDGREHWQAMNEREGLPRPLYLRAAAVMLPDGTRGTADLGR